MKFDLIERLRLNRPLRETSFWLLYFLFVTAEDLFDGEIFESHKIFQIFGTLITTIVITYCNYYLIFLRTWKPRFRLLYIIITAVTVAGYAYVITILVHDGEDAGGAGDLLGLFGYLLMNYLTLILIYSIYRFNFKYIGFKNDALKIKSLQNQNQKAELNLLRLQLNPHFLFNTLNNLYAYSLTQRTELPQLILHLSALTSYLIYDSQSELVEVSKELEFIENYISLERIRVEDDVKFNIDIDKNLAIGQIPPLLFLTVIENIFKHGIQKQSSSDYVKIQFSKKENRILLITENTFHNFIQIEPGQKGGMGLINLKKRLNLLFDDFVFEQTTKDGVFYSKFEVPLS